MLYLAQTFVLKSIYYIFGNRFCYFLFIVGIIIPEYVNYLGHAKINLDSDYNWVKGIFKLL